MPEQDNPNIENNINPIMSQTTKLNDKNGFVENIERVLNSENNATNAAASQKQIDHTLYWKIGKLKHNNFKILKYYY